MKQAAEYVNQGNTHKPGLIFYTKNVNKKWYSEQQLNCGSSHEVPHQTTVQLMFAKY